MSNLPRIMRGLGWLLFGLMWIPFTLIFMNMPGGRSSYNSIAGMPKTMALFFGLTMGMAFIATALLVGSSVVGWLIGRVVLARGESGTARILNIHPTGVRVNHYYHGMRFTLEVQTFGETFQADAEKLIPMHEMMKYQVGMIVNVKYDPMMKTAAMVE